jgi:hypothetical protein
MTSTGAKGVDIDQCQAIKTTLPAPQCSLATSQTMTAGNRTRQGVLQLITLIAGVNTFRMQCRTYAASTGTVLIAVPR